MKRRWRIFLESLGWGLYEGHGLWQSLRWAFGDLRREWKEKPPAPPTKFTELMEATLRARAPSLVANITKSNGLLQHLQRTQK